MKLYSPSVQLGDAVADAPARVGDDVVDRLAHGGEAHLAYQLARGLRAAPVGRDLHAQIERALLGVARVARDQIEQVSVSSSPARTMRITGSRMPSSKIEREPPAIEPGTAPPTSE